MFPPILTLRGEIMEKLEMWSIIAVPHTEDYPYEQLPEGACFEHRGNTGNTYTGLTSILEVVPEEE